MEQIQYLCHIQALRIFEDGNHILFGLKCPMSFNVFTISLGLRLILTVLSSSVISFLTKICFKKRKIQNKKQKTGNSLGIVWTWKCRFINFSILECVLLWISPWIENLSHPPVFLLCSHTTTTLTPLLTPDVFFFPTPNNSVARCPYNFTQFCHYLPRDSIRSHKLSTEVPQTSDANHK